jgi:hypothetical protein
MLAENSRVGRSEVCERLDGSWTLVLKTVVAAVRSSRRVTKECSERGSFNDGCVFLAISEFIRKTTIHSQRRFMDQER